MKNLSLTVRLLSIGLIFSMVGLAFVGNQNIFLIKAENDTDHHKGHNHSKSEESEDFYTVKGYKPVPIIKETKKSRAEMAAEYRTRFLDALVKKRAEYHTVAGTYYSIKSNLTATLMLNNKGNVPVYATPVIYNLSGSVLELEPLEVNAVTSKDFDLRQLLIDANAGAEFQEGSMTITYQGIDMQLGVQLKLIDERKSLMWEEQFFTPTMKHTSNKLEGVWWFPTRNNIKTKFVVSNTSNNVVRARVTVDGLNPEQTEPVRVKLNPHETKVFDSLGDIIGNGNVNLKRTGGISIKHNGSSGDILAKMMIAKPNKGYSSTMMMEDPEMNKSKRLHGAGLRLGKFAGEDLNQILVARNTGDELAKVKGKLIYTKEENVVAVAIPRKNIAPGKTKTINLKQIINSANIPEDVEVAGIEMSYDRTPGTVLMNVINSSQSGNHVFHTPMLDPKNLPSSAGGYPWKVDGDFSTIVYIKNETEEERNFTISLHYQGGQYALKVQKIKPNETRAIDFKKYRDEATPDDNDNIIPTNIEKGQIAWSVIGGNVNKSLTGYSEQVSETEGISSNYNCANCCPDSFYDSWVTPASISGFIGDTNQFVFNFRNVSCNGTVQPPQIAYFGVDWNSGNTSVATCNNNGVATGVGDGQTLIMGSFLADSYLPGGEFGCDWDPALGWGEGTCSIKKPDVDIDKLDAVGKSSSSSPFYSKVKVEVDDNPNNLPITLTLERDSGSTGAAIFKSTNNATKVITGTTIVEIKGVTESSTKDNMDLKATFTNNGNTSQLDKEDFTVISVSLSLKHSGQVSTNNSAKNIYQTALGTLNLGGPFLSSGTANAQWRLGIEIKGEILPSNFSKKLILDREIVSVRTYTRASLTSSWVTDPYCPNITPLQNAPCPDQSQAILIDDTPTPIYDLDAPGAYFTSAAQIGRIFRRRINFRQWVTILQKNGGSSAVPVRVSNDITWYFRQSIHKTSSGAIEVLSDVSKDNQVGAGTTNISQDLQ